MYKYIPQSHIYRYFKFNYVVLRLFLRIHADRLLWHTCRSASWRKQQLLHTHPHHREQHDKVTPRLAFKTGALFQDKQHCSNVNAEETLSVRVHLWSWASLWYVNNRLTCTSADGIAYLLEVVLYYLVVPLGCPKIYCYRNGVFESLNICK